MGDILGNRDEAIPERLTKVSEPSRESQLPKRFYAKAHIRPEADSYVVLLDDKPVKTPGRKTLAFSSQTIAEAVSSEWESVEGRIDPLKMPLTRLANTALDGVASDMQAVKEDITRYAGTDLICYRAETPQGLVDRQNRHWDPLVDWARTGLGVRLDLAGGVMHVAQPAGSMDAFGVHVGAIDDPLTLAALHVATSITGSAIIAMALFKRHLSLAEAWSAAHVDEDWNIEQWGEDTEASALRAARLRDMEAACLVLTADE